MNHRGFLLLLLCLVFASGMSRGDGERLVLVEEGVSKTTILVQAEDAKAALAGRELQRYIARMSGAMIPLLQDGEATPTGDGIVIHVGVTREVAALGLPIPRGFDTTPRPDYHEEEGYLIKTLGNRLIIAGNTDGPYHGTLYGAYALLHMLGCRWYFPGEYGEIVPERRSITVGPLEVLSRPDFAAREVNLGGWLPSSKKEKELYREWQLRIGMTVERPYPVAGDGFLAFLVDPNDYFESNPEYYAMNEQGVRERGRTVRHTMLCLSNEHVFEVAVKSIREMRDGTRTFNHFKNGVGISPPDGVPYCYCEACRQNSQNFTFPRYVHRTSQSEEFFGFAAQLAREFPDLYIGTTAYSLREMVPQGVEIPQNLAVCIAPISCDVLHPNDSTLWRRRDFVRNLKRWRSLTPHITIYDYNPGFLLGCFVPERDSANMAINVRLYKELGIKGMTREGRKAFMQTWISNYVMARMLWDAESDLDEIKDDFYTTFFGADAGPHVRAWWDGCEEALLRSPMQAHEDWLVNHIYTEAFARSLMKHVAAAQAAPATAQQKERIAAFALIADHLLAFGEMNEAEKQLDFHRAAAAAGRMVERHKELHEIYSFFHEYKPKQEVRRAFPGGRKLHFEAVASKIDGSEGELVAAIPMEVPFKRDPFNEGFVGGWYDHEFPMDDWESRDTYLTWDQQEEPLTEAGHDYDGYGWYRFTFDIPAGYEGRALSFYCGGVINEGWVWVNGQYVGHKDHKLWWGATHSFDMDITRMARVGQTNSVAIRVLNDAEIGGIYRRGFVWASTKTETEKGE